MKSNSALPRGSLTSKPTWSNASGVFRHVGFFVPFLMAHRPTGQNPFFLEEWIMLQLAIICLVVALAAAVLGFGGIAGSFMGIAKIVFVVFLILAVLSFVGGGIRRGRIWG